MRRTPLERWISERIHGLPGRELTREAIRRYQLDRLRHTIDYAVAKSPFYRERLRGLSGRSLNEPDDIHVFPFTTVEDLREHAPQFLHVSQSQIHRVVTVPHPEGRKKPRRLYFTEADLELTVDFFHRGMTGLVEPGRRVLILLLGSKPGSVGELLTKALGRIDVRAIVHGIVADPAMTISAIVKQKIDCLVGIPTQVLALARHQEVVNIPAGRIKSVLLVGDYVPSAIVNELRQVWGCRIFTAYTPTVMGYRGGVECEAFAGYHLCEADTYYEIVDPVSGIPRTPGEQGEIVVTMLTAEAMPLIRYRTGDTSRFLTDACPCGSVLRLMEKVRPRAHGAVRLQNGDSLSIADTDEVLFPVEGIVNYFATVTTGHQVDRLAIVIYPGTNGSRPAATKVASALRQVPAIGNAIQEGRLILEPVRYTDENLVTTCAMKRTIVQRYDKV